MCTVTERHWGDPRAWFEGYMVGAAARRLTQYATKQPADSNIARLGGKGAELDLVCMNKNDRKGRFSR